MSLRLEIIYFTQFLLFVALVRSHPVINNAPLNVVVNNTNYIDRNVTKNRVISHSVTEFQPPPLPKGNFPQNDVEYGNCVGNHQIVHNENIQVENFQQSTIDGVFEVRIQECRFHVNVHV